MIYSSGLFQSLFSFECTAYANANAALLKQAVVYSLLSGDDGREVPPVPFPNTAVKLSRVDDTWGETPWEN